MQAAADLLAVSYWTVRGLVEAGKLPAVRLPGRLIRIRPRDLESFVERHLA
jgi:excisionase family DNA binding protein